MSKLVKSMLEDLDLIQFTTKEDRFLVDRKIEEVKGGTPNSCDDIVSLGAITKEEVEEIALEILGDKAPEKRRKKRGLIIAR